MRDAALRRVAEVRRRGAAGSARLGDRADRRPRRPLRARGARSRRRPHRHRLGERRPRSDPGGATPDRPAARAATWATASSTPRDCGLASKTCRSIGRHSFPPRCGHGIRPRCASGRPTAGSRSSRSGRCSSGSTQCSDGCSSAAASSRSSSSGSSSTHRSTRTTSSCSGRSRWRRRRSCAEAAAPVAARRQPPSRRLARRRRAGRATASILRWFALQYPDVGGVTLEKAAELEEAASRRVSEKLAAEVNSPSVGRCKSAARAARPGSRSANAATAAAVAERHRHRRDDDDRGDDVRNDHRPVSERDPVREPEQEADEEHAHVADRDAGATSGAHDLPDLEHGETAIAFPTSPRRRRGR